MHDDLIQLGEGIGAVIFYGFAVVSILDTANKKSAITFLNLH